MRLILVLNLAILVLFSGCFRRIPDGMIAVPAGDFIMGTDEVDESNLAAEHGIVKPWLVDEGPAHRVHLPLYYIDKHEVTNARYAEYIREFKRSAPPYWENGQFAVGTGTFPVVLVQWHEAQAYCRSLGGRLPTEAEWEKAAKGGENRRYPWGNDFDFKKANIGGSVGDLSPVGSFEAGKSRLGAFDMVGNVWEWTNDWYEPYPGSAYESRSFGRKVKVIRGNSWSSIGHFSPEVQNTLLKFHSTTTYRLFAPPDANITDVGFRCIKPG